MCVKLRQVRKLKFGNFHPKRQTVKKVRSKGQVIFRLIIFPDKEAYKGMIISDLASEPKSRSFSNFALEFLMDEEGFFPISIVKRSTRDVTELPLEKLCSGDRTILNILIGIIERNWDVLFKWSDRFETVRVRQNHLAADFRNTSFGELIIADKVPFFKASTIMTLVTRTDFPNGVPDIFGDLPFERNSGSRLEFLVLKWNAPRTKTKF